MIDANKFTGANDREMDTVSIIANALLTKFGDEAAEVARYQLDAAGEETFKIWLGVLSHLPLSANRP